MMPTPTQIKEGLLNPVKAAKHLLNGSKTEKVFINKRTLREVLWLNEIYNRIDEVPGHIVELGVGPGTNTIIFGNLIKLYSDEDLRAYYGFDTFGGYEPEDLDSSPHLPEEAWQDLDVSEIRQTLNTHDVDDVTTLVKGDLKETLPEWIDNAYTEKKSPGNLHVALLYIDCNSYLPAKTGMEELFEYLSPGAIVCVDELRQGGETRALREFCEEHNLTFKKGNSPIAWAPYTRIPRNPD
jgi:hypothetical protein